MSGRQLVQCLMLVADERVDGAEIPPLSTYALLPKVFAEGRRGRGLLKFFGQKQVQILDDENVSRLIHDVGRYRIVEILLDGRPTVALFPLYVATTADCASLVKDILGLATVRVNAGLFYRSTRFAIDEHNSNVLGRLVSSRPEIPVSYSSNYTGSLLHMASELGWIELAELLLDHGADIECKNNELLAVTPLLVAIQACAFSVVQLLVDRGADLNARYNQAGFAPLHLARHVDVAEALLRNGALVDCATNRNVTPLFRLFEAPGAYSDFHRLAIVKLFLQYGAALEMSDPRGETVFVLDACLNAHAHEEFVCILENQFVHPAVLRQIKRFHIPSHSNVSFLPKFLRHVVKVVTLHRSAVFDTTLDQMWYDDERTLDEYRDDCETEIARLMSTLIPETCVSVHDILMSNELQVARLLQNDSVAGMAATEDLIARFPIYGRILSYLLERARFRKQLYDEGRKNLESLCSAFKNLLEDGLKQKILEFFVVSDYINLRKACSQPLIFLE